MYSREYCNKLFFLNGLSVIQAMPVHENLFQLGKDLHDINPIDNINILIHGQHKFEKKNYSNSPNNVGTAGFLS